MFSNYSPLNILSTIIDIIMTLAKHKKRKSSRFCNNCDIALCAKTNKLGSPRLFVINDKLEIKQDSAKIRGVNLSA